MRVCGLSSSLYEYTTTLHSVCCPSAGVREVTLCKDSKGKCGISFFSQSKGVFVVFVSKGSPASMAGIRFGDQILAVSNSAYGYNCCI